MKRLDGSGSAGFSRIAWSTINEKRWLNSMMASSVDIKSWRSSQLAAPSSCRCNEGSVDRDDDASSDALYGIAPSATTGPLLRTSLRFRPYSSVPPFGLGSVPAFALVARCSLEQALFRVFGFRPKSLHASSP